MNSSSIIRRARIAVMLGLVCALLFFRSATAQDPAWLQRNHFPHPERYEGLLDQPNARREYNVLSFVAVATPQASKLPKDMPVDLRLQFCRPSQSDGNHATRLPAFIEVRQLTGHVNYLMKTSEETPNPTEKNGLSTFEWPSGDVIRRNNIDPNNLGVVIHLGRDNEYSNIIAPAVFTTASTPLSTSVDHYELILRIQQNSLESLSYQVRPAAGPPIQCFYLNDFHPCEPSAPVGQPVIEAGSVVSLRFSSSSLPPGPTVVHVQGDYHNSDRKLEANFRFQHGRVCR